MGLNTGFRDWKLQRASAIVMIAYIGYLFAFFISHRHLTFDCWTALFSSTWMQVSTLVVFLMLAVHAWIGMWTIGTDYIKCACLRTVYEFCVFLALLGYFFWVMQILWSF